MMKIKIKLVTISCICFSTYTFASLPVWTFSPQTATTVIFPSNLRSSILYTVQNQSAQPHHLRMKKIKGITQVGECNLAPKGYQGDRCTLNLSIEGSELSQAGVDGGPVLCQTNQDGSLNSNQCYQPAKNDLLNITLGPPISSSIDWRTQGVVTPVKNQGSCQSSYAFSTTGAIEGFYGIHQNQLFSFSEQQLMDCAGNAGCDGGSVSLSLDYVISNGGIARESSYPYTATSGSCHVVSDINVNIMGYTTIPYANEIALAQQVEQQPVSASIKVGSWFQNYTSSDGVINPDCSSDTEYQSVLIVGYTPTYWIIKNSYGTIWGNAGYLYLIRGINACGIANNAIAPT